MNSLEKLEAWYSSHCDGEWEHHYGVSIETLDNPGWKLTVDLPARSKLADTAYKVEFEMDTHGRWMCCEIKDRKFIAAGGPERLDDMVGHFLDLVTE